MKKIIVTVVSFLVLFGFSITGARAQTTPWWTWDPPQQIDDAKVLTDIMVDPINNILEDSEGDEVVTVGEVPWVIATVEGFVDENDNDLGFNGVTYVIDDHTVGIFKDTAYSPLDAQPKVPAVSDTDPTPMSGFYEKIAAGRDGKLYILFTAGTVQYLLVGNPPEVTVKFTPRSLNQSSQGKWVTCKINGIPEGYSVQDINADSLQIVGIGDDFSFEAIVRAEGSPSGGRNKLMVKFDRQGLVGAIPDATGNVELTLVGTLGEDTLPFFGTDTFKTKFKIKKNPK